MARPHQKSRRQGCGFERRGGERDSGGSQDASHGAGKMGRKRYGADRAGTIYVSIGPLAVDPRSSRWSGRRHYGSAAVVVAPSLEKEVGEAPILVESIHKSGDAER